MHSLFHGYVAKQLGARVAERGVVVWYDKAAAFQPFVDEICGMPGAKSEVASAQLGDKKVSVVQFDGSYFAIRARVEHLVSADKPSSVVIYVAGVAHDLKGSVLMELEKAGSTWKPELKDLGRKWLTPKHTAGVLDELFAPDREVTYQDIVGLAEDEGALAGPSILKGIFEGSKGSDAIVAAWLASDAHDAEIDAKGAVGELTKLIASRLKTVPIGDAGLLKMRAIASRYVLASEFRLDLACEAPAALEAIPTPASKDEEVAIRAITRILRTVHAASYPDIADRIEAELNLRHASIPADALGAIDTFRFEEQVLLGHVGGLVAHGREADALALVSEREHSFWLDHDVRRKAQWEAVRRMAELATISKEVQKALKKAPSDASGWIHAYSENGGWYRLDLAQRRLETWVATLDDDPDASALAVVRRAYEDVCAAMAEGFSRALAEAGWNVSGPLHQNQVWGSVVTPQPSPVAYLLVDAMRYEMGMDLAESLPKTSEVSIRNAVGALPSITPIGMAALMPGAASSFSVVGNGGRIGAAIDGDFLPDLASRKKHLASRVPLSVDLTLDEVLSLQAPKLAKKLEGAQVIVVRSQEIDAAGEAGFITQARQAMDTMIANLKRALQKLATAGVNRAVVAADHGHLFFAHDRDDSMKIESPGGDTLDLHRRCWVGRGGATPAGCVRVAASALGYDSELDFVFPRGIGVFRAGGGLAYHHGGTTLQEMVIPVLTVVTKSGAVKQPKGERLSVSGVPASVTNRIFTVTVVLGDAQLKLGASEEQVQGILVSNGKQVGALGMAVEAAFDRERGLVTLVPGATTTVAFLLNDESAKSLRIVFLDPATDAEIYRSPEDIPVALGV